MPGRSFSGDNYRYGFQGQEKDDEIKGAGNSVNYKYRMHDPRLGRFFSVDPLASSYPHNSPYAFSENRVIASVELEGLEAEDLNENQVYNDITFEILEISDPILELFDEYFVTESSESYTVPLGGNGQVKAEMEYSTTYKANSSFGQINDNPAAYIDPYTGEVNAVEIEVKTDVTLNITMAGASKKAGAEIEYSKSLITGEEAMTTTVSYGPWANRYVHNITTGEQSNVMGLFLGGSITPNSEVETVIGIELINQNQ